jgi:hypothetical protein
VDCSCQQRFLNGILGCVEVSVAPCKHAEDLRRKLA